LVERDVVLSTLREAPDYRWLLIGLYERAKWSDGASIELGNVSLSQVGNGDVDFWWRCFCDDGRISHARERVLILSTTAG
jgi:hypothetical protein